MVSSSCEFGQYQTRPYFDGKYLKTITHIPAGRALNALIKLFAEIPGTSKNTDDIWEYIQGEISKIDNTNVDVNLNIFDGPLGAYGYISNMNEDNMTVGNIFGLHLKEWPKITLNVPCKLLQIAIGIKLCFLVDWLLRSLLKNDFGKVCNINYRVNSSMEDALMGLYIIAAKTQEFETPLQEIANKLRNNIAVTEN
ncbi:MAG: hypothetical protein U0Z26_09760 [Anaerolineales bacterium]